MKLIQTTVYLTEQQLQFAKENYLNLSKCLRKKLDEIIQRSEKH